MEFEITVTRLYELDGFLAKFVNPNGSGVNVMDGGLSWGLGRLAVKVQRIMKDLRAEAALIKPTEDYQEKMQQYNDARIKWLTENASLSDDEKLAHVEPMKDEFGVRDEISRLSQLEQEFFAEVKKVDLYRINRNSVGGMRDGDDPSKCVLSVRDSAFLQDLGLLYDPNDKD